MDSKAITLMIRYKDAAGKWKRSVAARGDNGRIKPGHALIDGRVVAVVNGTYDLRHTVDRKTAYMPAGAKAAHADALRKKLELKSAIKSNAKEAGVQVIEPSDSKTLKATATAYIQDAINRGAKEAAVQAKLVTGEFLRITKLEYIHEITDKDIFRYHEWLRKNQCGDRTVANKHMRLSSWLRFGGVDPKHIPPRPRFEKKLPNMYASAQTSALLAEADPYMRMVVLLALKTGLREQELMHVEFKDIDYGTKKLRVRAKPQWGFTVKVWEQRDIPLPTDVLEALKLWQTSHKEQDLILGTKNRRPNIHLLRTLKRLAHRAGLNCEQCDGCRESNECREYTLHRFRRTCSIRLLRGLDLRTVQQIAGHRDLESTMRYLVPETTEESQAKIDRIEW